MVQFERLELTTRLFWQEKYNAYTSMTDRKPNVRIEASASYLIDLGQTLKIETDQGTGSVTTTGVPGAISIHNLVEKQFTVGIAQEQPNGDMVPMCAYDSFGGFDDVIAPIEEVLLMFATEEIDTGTVIEQSFSPAIKTNLTGAPGNTRSVEFHLNKNWTWGKFTWAVEIRSGTDLLPFLIQKDERLSEAHLKALQVA